MHSFCILTAAHFRHYRSRYSLSVIASSIGHSESLDTSDAMAAFPRWFQLLESFVKCVVRGTESTSRFGSRQARCRIEDRTASVPCCPQRPRHFFCAICSVMSRSARPKSLVQFKQFSDGSEDFRHDGITCCD